MDRVGWVGSRWCTRGRCALPNALPDALPDLLMILRSQPTPPDATYAATHAANHAANHAATHAAPMRLSMQVISDLLGDCKPDSRGLEKPGPNPWSLSVLLVRPCVPQMGSRDTRCACVVLHCPC